MRLALRELRRRPGRFAVATAILTLIAVLLTFLGGLLDGLEAGSTGAYRAQQGDLIVFADGAQTSLVRSRIEPEVRAQVEDAVPDGAVGGLGSAQLGGRLEGRGPRDLVGTVVFGYELAPRGLPDEPPGPGEVYADDSLRSEGVEEGTVIQVGPARTELTVVGFTSDAKYSGQGTLWGSVGTWRQVLGENRPSAAVGEGTVQALVVAVPDGADPADVAEAIDEATGGATETLTIAEAIDALPGLAQQRQTFSQIIGVTVLIAIVVVALFFALITVERTALYGVLKALGARSATLFGGVLLQAVLVTLVALAIGVGAALLLDAVIPAGSLPFAVTSGRLLSSAAALLFAAAVGAAFSLRRVLRVDPASAIGGGA